MLSGGTRCTVRTEHESSQGSPMLVMRARRKHRFSREIFREPRGASRRLVMGISATSRSPAAQSMCSTSSGALAPEEG